MANISAQRTVLEWDNYVQYLIEAIGESNFMKRAEDKGMQTPKNELEAHVTSRARHVTAAAEIARRIASALGLNADYIYAAMLMHDAGHPYTAHDGEETFTGIGEDYEVEYFHHNGKGVEVVISENICEKAISKIPNIANRPELRKKLEEEFYYFLDVIISHDGEAGVKEMGAKPTEYPDMRTAVFQKLRLSNSTNNYKFIAQTIEGRIAKYADVIAYLSSDILDRFRLGIQKDFDEDYLEFFGDILSTDFTETREERIEIAKKIIEEIKEDKVMQLVSDARAEENKEIIMIANKIIEEIYRKVENYEELKFEEQGEKAEEIAEEFIANYYKEHFSEDMSDEEKKFLNADITRIREFTRKKLRMRTAVIEEITSRVREALIQDLLKESRSKGDLGFSSDMRRLFFRAKELNYKYVPDTKLDYLREKLPVATHKLVHMVALALRKTGAIEDKFYDPAMRKHIKDEGALECLRTLGYVDTEERDKYRKKYGIRGIRRSTTSKFTSEGGKRERAVAIKELCNSAYHYVLDSGELFAIQYENTYYAVENQIVSKVRSALGKASPTEKKKRKTNIKFFDSKLAREEARIREKFIRKYGTIENITEEQILEFARPMVEASRRKMEGKMAVQMAINYISAMGDKTVQKHLEDIGFISREDFVSSTRGSTEEERAIFEGRYDTKVDDGKGEK